MSDNFSYVVSLSDKIYPGLQSDCGRCFGLCCVALYFSSTEGFPVDKDPGLPCPNLQPDFHCRVYKGLEKQGLKGCTSFDCFGAGQKVCQRSFSGHDWQKEPGLAEQMFEVFLVMRQLHELLWYLNEALVLEITFPIHGALRAMVDETERLTYLSPDALLKLDVAGHRVNVDVLLQKTSGLVRAEACHGKQANLGERKALGYRADLSGADLRKIDLRGENLRGAYLIAADLRGAKLVGTDLIGADFRDADLRGADLTKSLFLTQAQINSARGDSNTKLPASLTRPKHWGE